MFLGTPRRWWIVAGLLFVVALVLIGTNIGGALGTPLGILLLFVSIGVFGMSPMRYGRGSREPVLASPNSPTETEPVTMVEPAGPRPVIDARDPSDV
jgi:hypothetical protein